MRHSVATIGEPHVERDGDQDHHHVAPVELVEQHADDQRDLDDGRQQLQDHHAHDGLDAVAAALQHARQPAGLALEMEAQRQLVHVLEGEEREPPHRVHRDLGEHAVAQLRERRHQDAHAAVGQRHRDRRGDRPGQPGVGRDRRAALPGQRIDRPFEGERHRDGRELGERTAARSPSTTRRLQVARGRTARCRATAAAASQQRAAVGGDLALHRYAAIADGCRSWHPARQTGARAAPSASRHIGILHIGNIDGARFPAIGGLRQMLPHAYNVCDHAACTSAMSTNSNESASIAAPGPGSDPAFVAAARTLRQDPRREPASAWSMAAARSG